MLASFSVITCHFNNLLGGNWFESKAASAFSVADCHKEQLLLPNNTTTEAEI